MPPALRIRRYKLFDKPVEGLEFTFARFSPTLNDLLRGGPNERDSGSQDAESGRV
jgi:hypothetical protein